jgi:hypothetical protein
VRVCDQCYWHCTVTAVTLRELLFSEVSVLECATTARNCTFAIVGGSAVSVIALRECYEPLTQFIAEAQAYRGCNASGTCSTALYIHAD